MPPEIVIDYEPRAPQWELHRAVMGGAKRRHVLCIWHRRCGKSVGWLNQLQRSALTTKRTDGRYYYVAPLYRQAKSIAWDYLRRFSLPIPGTVYHESELRVDYPNGSRIQLFGADNPDSLRGIYADGIALDEYGQIDPRLRSQVLIPALTDRGGFEIVGGTPQGRNGFWELYERVKDDPAWWVSIRRASETGILSPEQLAEARKEIGDDEIYEQEFECSFAAGARGAYFAKLVETARKEGRIGKVPYETQLPVTTCWDLGIGDATTIWFVQQTGREVRCIDYYEADGESLAHYAKVLQDRGYAYREHIAPHDIEVRELGTGRSRREVAQSLGMNFRVAPKLPVEDGIEAVRNLFPRCWFDLAKCKAGIDALSAYRKDYDEKREVYRSQPLHDWSSHASDAMRYLAVSIADSTHSRVRRAQPDTAWVV